MLKRTIVSLGTLGLVAAMTRCGGSTSTVDNADSGTGQDSGGGRDGTVDGGGGDTGGGHDSGGGGDTGGGDTGEGFDTGGGGDGGGCNPACTPGRLCCSGACINPDNDPQNCGDCGVQCTGATPYCDGSCKPLPCGLDAATCSNAGECCGLQCCNAGDICCKDEGPVGGNPTCYTPTPAQPTCPQGCAPQCVSDRNLKQEITPIDGREVLERLASVPMSTWSYKSDDPSVRHLGPMAQDFHAAFGLGNTDRAYDPIDAHGVAFAAIQGLYQMVQEQNARIEHLEQENTALRNGVCSGR